MSTFRVFKLSNLEFETKLKNDLFIENFTQNFNNESQDNRHGIPTL